MHLIRANLKSLATPCRHCHLYLIYHTYRLSKYQSNIIAGLVSHTIKHLKKFIDLNPKTNIHPYKQDLFRKAPTAR